MSEPSELWHLTKERLRVMYRETFGIWPPDAYTQMDLVNALYAESRNP